MVELIGFSDITEGANQSILCLLENFYLSHSFTLLNSAVQAEKEEENAVFYCIGLLVFLVGFFFFLRASMNWLLISDTEISEYLNRRKDCLASSLIKLFFAVIFLSCLIVNFLAKKFAFELLSYGIQK